MVKPTIAQIEIYMQEKGCFIEDEAELFYSHYEMCGWTWGKHSKPLKSWKAAISGWLIRNKRRHQDAKAKRHNNNNSFADRQRQQANQARTEIQQAQLGLYPDNARPLRSVG